MRRGTLPTSLLDEKVNTKKELKKLKNEMKDMKEEYKNCTEALLKEVYEKNKAEEMCKVLKDTVEAEKELNKVAEDKEKQSDCDQKEINSVEEMSVDGEKDSDRWKKQSSRKNRNKKSAEVIYTCDECNMKCKLEDELVEHNKVYHSKKTEEICYSCKKCDWRSETENELRVHTRQHHSEQTFKCNKCDKIYTKMARIRRHDC